MSFTEGNAMFTAADHTIPAGWRGDFQAECVHLASPCGVRLPVFAVKVGVLDGDYVGKDLLQYLGGGTHGIDP